MNLFQPVRFQLMVFFFKTEEKNGYWLLDVTNNNKPEKKFQNKICMNFV